MPGTSPGGVRSTTGLTTTQSTADVDTIGRAKVTTPSPRTDGPSDGDHATRPQAKCKMPIPSGQAFRRPTRPSASSSRREVWGASFFPDCGSL
jgi:hypothetical protein